MRFFVHVVALASAANAYFLTGMGVITTERIDPIVNPGAISSHVHAFFGGSNVRLNTSTASLRQSQCTSVGIKEDKSVYWFPQLYFHHTDNSGVNKFTSVHGGGVVDNPAITTTPFPDDFRMISGNLFNRNYDPNSFAQQAVSFLCLNFQERTPPPTSGLPTGLCPSGIRAQINFPSCWDGQNLDSPDHKSHVAFPSGGPDKGTCSDPKFPKTLPRIFSEIYWSTQEFDSLRSTSPNPNQPFVFAQGDPTGYGYHGDFFNGWEPGVLQKVIANCTCNPFGDPKCCEDRGVFTINKETNCKITPAWNEQTTGTLLELPGNNPVQPGPAPAVPHPNDDFPARIDPIYAYVGDKPTATGQPVGTNHVLINSNPTNAAPPAVSSSAPPVPPTQPTPPKDSSPSPSPVPSVTAGLPNQPSPPAPSTQPTPTPDDPDHDQDDYCYSSKDKQRHPGRHNKRHHRRMHNAAFEGSF